MVSGFSRRALLAAGTALGTVAALSAGARTPASAAPVFGTLAPAATLGMTGTVVGRHANLFRNFALAAASGVDVITVGTARYLVTLNAGDGVDTVQIFHADSGALYYKASTPTRAAGTLAHDGKGNLYLTSGAALLAVSVPNKTIRTVASLPSGITSLFGIQFDYKGRLWAGAFPAGVVLCLDPANGAELGRTPRLGSGNQYVRQMSVSPDGKTLWAGTGTADPDLFRVDVDAPTTPARVGIPNRVLNNNVLGVVARGRKVFVWHTKPAGGEVVAVYDVVSKTWSGAPASICARSITQPDAQGWVYVNAFSSVKRFRPTDATMVAESVAPSPDRITVATILAGSTIYLPKTEPSVLSSGRVTTAGATQSRVNYRVVPVPLPTQSMIIDRATNTAYAGGYRGDGLCSTDLTTGAFAHSAPTSGLEQIEGMTVDQGTLYAGSYTGAAIVRHRTAGGVEDGASYTTLAKLGSTHGQDRPFGWASTTSHIVFGTVPNYGHRGGALGTIERSTGQVTVYNKLLPELSIVGLVGSGDTVYGTTSCLGGYGSDVYSGDAVVFAADASTGRVLWKRALPGVQEVYGPVHLNGKVYAATPNSVVELRASDGLPLRTFVLSTRTGKLGWQAVELVQIPNTTRLVHLAGGVVRVLQLASGQSATVLTGADQHIDFDAQNAMWVTVGNDIVKLRMDLVSSPAAIKTKYTALGGASKLGYPLGKEEQITSEAGVLQKFFRNGRATSIYWSQALGAYGVTTSDSIGKKFVSAGNAHNGYGLPTTDETKFTGGVHQTFSKVGRGITSVYATSSGTFAVKEYRAVGKAWAAAGREDGWGWPVDDEHYIGAELVQSFSNGYTAHYVSGKKVWTTRS